MIDYSTLDSAIGHNWYDLDPDLQARVRRDCPPEDFEWADAKLREFGGLVGERVAPNSEVVDAHPPELRRYDQWAEEVNEIVHHPAAVDSKRALWASGYVGGFARDEADRGRPAPGVMLAATSYLLSQADTGLVCSLGMTSGVAGLVAAYAPPDVRDALLPGLRGDSFDGGVDGSMFLTERDGGSDLGRTVHCTARDVGDGRVVINGEKWFCSNIDGAAIVMLARPEGAPDGPAGLGLYLVPKEREDGSRNGISMRRLKPKLGTKSVPTGEVEFHDALGYALRPTRSRNGGGSDSDAGGLGRMMEMVNGSRFGVSLMGLGIARRSFLEGTIWAHHRRAKGRLLVDLPLIREQLVDLLAELEAAFALGFECAAAARSPRRRPPPAHPRPGGEGAAVPVRRRGREQGRRAPRRQRVLRGLAAHAPAARRAVPPDLGRHRADLPARRPACHPARHRPRSCVGAHRPRRSTWRAPGPSTSPTPSPP